jgi:hypothetical protein
MMEQPPDRWVTMEEAARAVHASTSLIEKWVRESKVAICQDAVSHTLLVSADGVEDAAEGESFICFLTASWRVKTKIAHQKD